MLTLHHAPENVYVCDLVEGKKRTPVFWHPKINADMRNAVDNLEFFNTDYNRDRFELSKDQASDIFAKLGQNETLENNQNKFFKVKRFVTESLESEMDLAGTAGKFEINFPPGDKFEGHTLICGGTNSGKTWSAVDRILRNLKGPKKDRRNFLIFSAEYHNDRTLQPLKHERFRDNVLGVDCSETTVKDSQWDGPEQFFENEIMFMVNSAPPGSVILFDDAMDTPFPTQMRTLINRMLRVGRHQGLNIMVILHSLRSATWSSQAHQSAKYLYLFPRSSKGKIISYLNRDLGIPLAKARDHVRAFSQSGRVMVVRLHAPELLLGDQLCRLI